MQNTGVFRQISFDLKTDNHKISPFLTEESLLYTSQYKYIVTEIKIPPFRTHVFSF